MVGLDQLFGERIYAMAGYDPASPPPGGCADLALAIRGPDALFREPWAPAEHTHALFLDGVRRIVIRRGMSPGRANFGIGVELARLTILDEAWRLDGFAGLIPEDIATAVGCWLAAPTCAVRALLEIEGPNIAAVAHVFTVTQTAATMRIAEVGGPACAVATPTVVHRRGTRFDGFDDRLLRELAAKRSPRSVRREVLSDEPGRVALLALAA